MVASLDLVLFDLARGLSMLCDAFESVVRLIKEAAADLTWCAVTPGAALVSLPSKSVSDANKGRLKCHTGRLP
jgi:hypothetical protein